MIHLTIIPEINVASCYSCTAYAVVYMYCYAIAVDLEGEDRSHALLNTSAQYEYQQGSLFTQSLL